VAFYKPTNYRRFVWLLVVLPLTNCMVGPDFKQPISPPVAHYTESPLPIKTAGSKTTNSQRFIFGDDLPTEWWQLFHSNVINELVIAGLKHNPSLAAAKSALQQAREMVNVQIGNSLYPAVNGTSYIERQRFATTSIGFSSNKSMSNSIPSTFNLSNASVNVSYTLDFFGGARREIESLRAQVDYQQFEVMAAYLTLTTNIVTTAISIASYNAQINATYELIKAQQGLLTIFNDQYRLGGGSNTNVLAQRALVEQTRATLPSLEKNLSFAKHALTMLVGEFPATKIPILKLDELTLPTHLPISLPSNLVRQRPDIRASEALLHAASAQIGVTTANLLPNLSLTAAYGYTGNIVLNLINNQNKVWNIISQYAQPIFHGGALLSQRRAAIAAYQQAYAQYRQTVLQAFQNVADCLKAIEMDAQRLQAQQYAENLAKQSLVLYQTQFKLGGVSYIDLFNAQQQYQQILLNRIQAQAARYSDTVALFQSLGGGWWHKNKCVENCL
jgi:NodT family efflux transporter outer membrane factor (OMF) lipoprotein